MITRKCIGLILAFLLLVSNVGLAFEVHYCGNKIANVEVKLANSNFKHSKKCCEKKLKVASCCSNKVINFEKKSEDATVKTFFFHFDAPLIITENPSFVFKSVSNFKNKQIISYHCEANAPPLFKLYNQYLFYA
ncbi:HYC_CC_PP family protein [Flavobacterium flavipallidum]|uniref:Uncharacterized protein n=1 Tax=Flavobacterium flavipallidum TaxID=3139140 RepID=A0ABU9HIC0_9FLAO